MYVLHNRATKVAEVYLGQDGQPPTVLTDVSEYHLPAVLWNLDVVLTSTGHWLPYSNNRHRHGLDPAPSGHEGSRR